MLKVIAAQMTTKEQFDAAVEKMLDAVRDLEDARVFLQSIEDRARQAIAEVCAVRKRLTEEAAAGFRFEANAKRDNLTEGL